MGSWPDPALGRGAPVPTMPEEIADQPLHLLAIEDALKLAGISPSDTLEERLKKAGILHFDELIHEQLKPWLVQNFPPDGGVYPINVARLIRNLIWQTKERVAGGAPPFKDLLRTYWYKYVKPTLARADALAEKADQYKQLSDNLADLVKVYQVLKYKQIGFRDENQPNRLIGEFRHVIPFAEKLGHFDYLSELHAKHQVSVIALGGQPSVMNAEYFVDDLKKRRPGLLRRSFYLYSIVDFDPSGWIIRDAFMGSLRFYGVKSSQVEDLINPDVLTPDEIMQARFPVPAGPDMEEKNRRWFEAVSDRRYANMKYLVEETAGGRKLYGLEAEAISTEKLDAALKKFMEPILNQDEAQLKVYEMRKLDKAVKDLILFKVTHPDTP